MGGFQKGQHLDYIIYEWSLRDVFESKYINKTNLQKKKKLFQGKLSKLFTILDLLMEKHFLMSSKMIMVVQYLL